MSTFTDKAAATPAPKSFARRDHIRANELKVQEKWADDKTFERLPEFNEDGTPKPKFMVTFPYPYMNGRLHLGHAFSLTKAEFAVRFQRLQGKNALWPFAFHCTGMPIQAAANKLRDEIAKYGCPPVFPAPVAADDADKEAPVTAAEAIAAKSKGKKTKLAVKGLSGPVYQWNILAQMVPAEEIHLFTDPKKWLEYFSPLGATDLKLFGCAIDYRRSFITTSANQYYDKFIRWQFNRLKMGDRIKFGKRAAIYSAVDKQVCADHDRSSGEGVGPQEYTIIKLEVIRPFPEGSPLACPALEGKRVFLAPATLRPETMYGQTNCFVLPEGDYGAYELNTGEVLVISARSARGMAHQDYMATWGEATCLVPLKGTDLLGLPLKAPNATFERVYTLPLPTISMFKGTGVVTSVPSDAPDDYVALKELQDKPLWREKFGITAEMVEPFKVVPIIRKLHQWFTIPIALCSLLRV
jgi:leucyl-tRNA synthetase